MGEKADEDEQGLPENDRGGGGARLVALLALALCGLAAALALLLCGLRLSGIEAGWPLVPVLALFPYLVPVAAALSLVGALARRRWILLPALLTLVVAVISLLPRIAPSGPDDLDGTALTVLVLNLQFGTAEAAEVVELVRESDADVLTLHELTPTAARALREEGLRELLPEQVLLPHRGVEGNGVAARFGLEPLEGTTPVVRETPFVRVLGEPAPGTTVDITAVHPLPPIDAGLTPKWSAGLEGLPAEPGGRSGILAGDFNASFDHAQLREVVGRGYHDSAGAVGDGLPPTWPVGKLWPPVTIDHVLVAEEVEVEDVETARVEGTDHRAVIARLVVPAD